ncbi:MAG: DNA replication and repair protein RecF [Verrucomicrobiota bacterium JB022]|nr:DNA replication and repair protein RecF [Verrucomicrobiota bacterium JB022]
MRFKEVRLSEYRNVQLQALTLEGRDAFVVGPNGQGKTNLLEALSLVTALRSFRTTQNRTLVRWGGGGEARLFFRLEHEQLGETELELSFKHGSKQVWLDGEKVGRLGEVLGRFPTVPFSSQDIQLLRGTPQARRQFLDLAIAAVDARYLDHLRKFHQALKERNRCLKERRPAAVRNAFEPTLAEHAAAVVRLRREAMAQLSRHLEEAYQTIATEDESPELCYLPNVEAEEPDAYGQLWKEHLERDQAMESTQRGPHRDDFNLRLFDRRAREYGSEGQQRGLVLSLRLAQARWFFERTGVHPVILADDILGELDPRRRQGFWNALLPDTQVIASGTELPRAEQSRPWAIWRVENGIFSPDAA